MKKPAVKICGITDIAALDAALDAGADYVGLVFYAPSPRHLDLAKAEALAGRMQGRCRAVALSVDADDTMLDAVVTRVRPAVLQLHGDEPPDRVHAIRNRFGLPVMKAIRVATRDDVALAAAYEPVADWILFDAKVEKHISHLPGGTGVSFDWNILSSYRSRLPWMLSGGLNAGNIQTALSLLRPDAVDASSGVETSPGVKNPEKIKEFVAAVQSTD